MRSILVDIRTMEFYSEEHGWNEKEASIRQDWEKIIYSKSGPLSPNEEKEKWENRNFLCVCLPQEPEILT